MQIAPLIKENLFRLQTGLFFSLLLIYIAEKKLCKSIFSYLPDSCFSLCTDDASHSHRSSHVICPDLWLLQHPAPMPQWLNGYSGYLTTSNHILTHLSSCAPAAGPYYLWSSFQNTDQQPFGMPPNSVMPLLHVCQCSFFSKKNVSLSFFQPLFSLLIFSSSGILSA